MKFSFLIFMEIYGIIYSIHGKFVSYLFSKETWALQPVKMSKILNNNRYYMKHNDIKFCKI